MLLAAYYGQTEIARLLADHASSLDIFEASAVGDLAAVQRLVSGQPELANDYAADGFQPLGLACFFSHSNRRVSLLLGARARINRSAS